LRGEGQGEEDSDLKRETGEAEGEKEADPNFLPQLLKKKLMFQC